MLDPKPHPTPVFEKLFASFGEKHVAGRVSRFLYRYATVVWRAAFRIDRAERRIGDDFARGLDGFHHPHWLFQSYFYPEFVASFLLEEDEERDPIRKAAQLIHGALIFRRRALESRLQQEYEADGPLDMRRYRLMFSRIFLQARVNGKDVQTGTDYDPTDYVLVSVRGLMYRLQCLSEGEILAYDQIRVQLERLVLDAADRAERTPSTVGHFGLLTVLFTPEHARLYRELAETNERTLDTINRALFAVSLDLDDHPSTLDQTFRTLHSDNWHNRDHRRSMHVAVTGNGRGAVVVNPHAGIGGTLSAKFVSELFGWCSELRRAPPSVGDGIARYEHLDLRLPDGWEAALARSRGEVERRLCSPREKTTFRFDRIGRRDFEARGLSADGAYHCALHLAYQRCFGKIPVTGNFINLRNVQHGDIWKYTSTTAEMERFVGKPDAGTLREAIAAHRKRVKVNKRADDEIYLGAMSLVRLISDGEIRFAAFPALMVVMSVFVRDFARRFMFSEVWVSNIPAIRGLEVAGRASVRLSYVGRGCFGGHYLLFDDHVNVCILASLDDPPGATPRLMQTLEKCLHELKDMVEIEDSDQTATA